MKNPMIEQPNEPFIPPMMPIEDVLAEFHAFNGSFNSVIVNQRAKMTTL